jgi:hypothetical protein
MNYTDARNSKSFFNRRIYKDGWYRVDSRGEDISVNDFSVRKWSEEDVSADDWWTIEIALNENMFKLNQFTEGVLDEE